MVGTLTDIDIQPRVQQCHLYLFDNKIQTTIATNSSKITLRIFPHCFRFTLFDGIQFGLQIGADFLIGNELDDLFATGRRAKQILIDQTDFLEHGLDDAVGTLHTVMHLFDNCHPAGVEDVQIFSDCTAMATGQVARGFVAHPAMNTTATTEHPQQMLETKVLCGT